MKKYSPLLTVNVTILTLGFFVYVLYIGASIVIPFVVAVLLSFMVISISHFYEKKWLHKVLSFIVAIFTIALVFYGIWKLINSNVEDIIVAAPEYQEKFISILDVYAEQYNIDARILRDEVIGKINFTNLLSWAATAITSIVKNAGIIFFFMVFILLESKSFKSKLALITGGEKSTFFNVFDQIQDDMKSYFKIKTITSIAVWFLSAIIMFFFGLDFLIFWAFIIFLLNYIPNVGSIIAVSFPVMFSLVQFESVYLTTVFLLCMVGAQVLIWNLVEPRMMGNKLNLSPLVILISLIFWGTLWGPVGMLLSVPIMVMINITLSHIEVTRPIAVLLSEKWIIKFTPPKWGDRKTYNLNKMKKLLKSSKN
jgi:AI-2 transport protein TqsA